MCRVLTYHYLVLILYRSAFLSCHLSSVSLERRHVKFRSKYELNARMKEGHCGRERVNGNTSLCASFFVSGDIFQVLSPRHTVLSLPLFDCSLIGFGHGSAGFR